MQIERQAGERVRAVRMATRCTGIDLMAKPGRAGRTTYTAMVSGSAALVAVAVLGWSRGGGLLPARLSGPCCGRIPRAADRLQSPDSGMAAPDTAALAERGCLAQPRDWFQRLRARRLAHQSPFAALRRPRATESCNLRPCFGPFRPPAHPGISETQRRISGLSLFKTPL